MNNPRQILREDSTANANKLHGRWTVEAGARRQEFVDFTQARIVCDEAGREGLRRRGPAAEDIHLRREVNNPAAGLHSRVSTGHNASSTYVTLVMVYIYDILYRVISP